MISECDSGNKVVSRLEQKEKLKAEIPTKTQWRLSRNVLLYHHNGSVPGIISLLLLELGKSLSPSVTQNPSLLIEDDKYLSYLTQAGTERSL